MKKSKNISPIIRDFKNTMNIGLVADDFRISNEVSSKIIIENLKIFAKHGVLPEENIIGTYYIINVEIHANLWIASETDILTDTINYAAVNEVIHQEMSIRSRLLEHVIGRIFKALEKKFPKKITYIKIKLTKNNPPMKGEMQGISIEMEKKLVDNIS